MSRFLPSPRFQATLDPHVQNEGQPFTFAQQVYEPPITRAPNLDKEPCLALSWRQVDAITASNLPQFRDARFVGK